MPINLKRFFVKSALCRVFYLTKKTGHKNAYIEIYIYFCKTNSVIPTYVGTYLRIFT